MELKELDVKKTMSKIKTTRPKQVRRYLKKMNQRTRLAIQVSAFRSNV